MSQVLNKSSGNSPSPNPVATGPSPNLLNNQPNVAQPQQPYTPVFTTDKIQHTKATKPREYFDEQNRKTAERKKQDNKNRKTIIIIGAAIIGVLALIAIIWWVVIKVNQPTNNPSERIPIVTNGSDEDIDKVREYLQDIYNDTDNDDDNSIKLEAANNAINDMLNEPEGEEYVNQINLAKLLFYVDNGLHTEIIANKDTVDPAVLDLRQRATYYNILASAYRNIGDIEQANNYLKLTSETLYELNGPVEDPNAEE